MNKIQLFASLLFLGLASGVDASPVVGEWVCPDIGQQIQLRISPDGTFSKSSTNSNIIPWSGTWKETALNVVTLTILPSRTQGIATQGFSAQYRVKLSAGKMSMSTPAAASFENCALKPTESAPKKILEVRELNAIATATGAKKEADKQPTVADEREIAEAKLPESRRGLVANGSGPMLCVINGRSKPTMYLDLGANFEFKLVRDGLRPVSGKWRSGSFQGQRAVILQTPESAGDRFPDLYTVYEDSITFVPSSISLTLARRSTFPGSLSAEAYEAVCVKAKSVTLEQAEQLTGANLKNNPLRPEAQAKRQQEEAQRPSAAYCTRLEDTYADRPALQKQLLAKMGCS